MGVGMGGNREDPNERISLILMKKTFFKWIGKRNY